MPSMHSRALRPTPIWRRGRSLRQDVLFTGVRAIGSAPAAADVLHVIVNVVPELQQSTAQVVQPGFAVVCADQAVLGAFAIAGERICAFPALSGKGVELVEAEFLLLLGEDHSRTGSLHDVAELVFGIDVVIAGIQAAIVLQRDAFAAEFVINAELRFLAHPLGHRGFEIG